MPTYRLGCQLKFKAPSNSNQSNHLHWPATHHTIPVPHLGITSVTYPLAKHLQWPQQANVVIAEQSKSTHPFHVRPSVSQKQCHCNSTQTIQKCQRPDQLNFKIANPKPHHISKIRKVSHNRVQKAPVTLVVSKFQITLMFTLSYPATQNSTPPLEPINSTTKINLHKIWPP